MTRARQRMQGPAVGLVGDEHVGLDWTRIGCLIALALSGCAEWKPASSVTSPDGRTIAELEVALAGASAGNRTRVTIRNGADGGLLAPVQVVEADNVIVGFTKLRWLDADYLEVTVCEATSFRVSAENFRDPPLISTGEGDGEGVPNAVRVELRNLTYSASQRRCVPRKANGS